MWFDPGAAYELVFWSKALGRAEQLPQGMARRFRVAPPEGLGGDAFWQWAKENEVPPFVEVEDGADGPTAAQADEILGRRHYSE